MALRIPDRFLHPARRASTVLSTGRKDSRALALDNSARMGSYGYGLQGPKLKDYASYLSVYRSVSWVRACVQVIAYNAANINFRLVKPGGETEDDDEEVLDSPFLDLLTKPNPYQTGFALREAWWTDLELTGNAYISLEAMTPRGVPTELYRLNPSRVTVLPDREKFIAGYRYTVNGRHVDYLPNEVVHLKYTNPLDDYYGMGTIESGEARFESEIAMIHHERNFWASGAKIMGLFGTDESLDDSTFSRIQDRMRQFFGGSGYSTMLMENGLKYQSVSDSPAKLGMLDMALASRDQILAMFGVPPTKLGILEKANYKADEADRFFWTETLDPKLTRVEEGLQALADLFHAEQGYRLRFKRLNFTDDVPQMTVAKLMADVGVYTADEIRAYTGRDPLPEHGDVLIAQIGTVPLDLGGPMATINERRKDMGLQPIDGGDAFIILPARSVPLDVSTGEVGAAPPKIPTPGQPMPNGQQPTNVVPMRPPAQTPAVPAVPTPTTAAAGKAMATKAYDYGSTQVNLPDNLATAVQRYQQTIAPDDLAAGGLEAQPHITVKFGLHAAVKPEHVARVLADQSPVQVRFGKTAVFPEGDDGVPLFVSVESPDLEQLHSVLTDALPNTETHSTYQPHATIAYVKPEAVAKYVDQAGPLNTRTAIFDTVVHSATDGSQTPITLGRTGKAITSTSVMRPATAHVLKQHRKKALDHALKTHKPALEQFFGSQEQRVKTRLASVPRKQKAALVDAPWWDSTEEDSALGETLAPLWTDALTAGVAAARSVGVPVKGESDARMQQLKQGLASRVTSINETTRTAVAAQVTEGLRRGYSSAQIASGVPTEDYSGVGGVFEAAKGYRATMIARTELSTAFNQANIDTYQQSGVVREVEIADGTEFDEECAARDGEIIPLDEADDVLASEHPNGTIGLLPVVE